MIRSCWITEVSELPISIYIVCASVVFRMGLNVIKIHVTLCKLASAEGMHISAN